MFWIQELEIQVVTETPSFLMFEGPIPESIIKETIIEDYTGNILLKNPSI